MWLNSVNNLCVYKSRYINILTRYTACKEADDLAEMQALKFALKHQDCENFLISKAATIETLQIQADGLSSQMHVEHLQLKVKSFKHVRKLIFYQIAITDEDLQVIGENCPQLKSLSIIKCFCDHLRVLIPGVNCNIAEICNMKHLQELEIQPHKPPGVERLLKLEYIQAILYALPNLKHLNLKNFTIICAEAERTGKSFVPSRNWSLEVLDMGLISFDFWCTFTGFLKSCSHLRDLSIQATLARDITINFKIIDILSVYCRNLQILKLESCEIDVENFGDLPALQEITLRFCRGLTFNNLQQLLGGLKLKIFNLIHTRVFDTDNFIYISPTLESITVETVHFTEISEMFQRSLNDIFNLKSLRWLHGDINHNWIMAKCPQLQQLHLANCYHLWHIVHNMKCLRDLTITNINEISWSLLHGLIFQLSLKRLKIYTKCAITGAGSCHQKSLMMPTTLEFLAIPLKIFLTGVKYWLELLDINKHLNILMFGEAEDILNVKLICLLLATDSVRQRHNRLKICGFKLELENFEKRTILREIAYVQINTNHYKEKKKPFTLEL